MVHCCLILNIEVERPNFSETGAKTGLKLEKYLKGPDIFGQYFQLPPPPPPPEYQNKSSCIFVQFSNHSANFTPLLIFLFHFPTILPTLPLFLFSYFIFSDHSANFTPSPILGLHALHLYIPPPLCDYKYCRVS